MSHLHIIDFRAVVKHAYYGARDEEAIHCLETDRKFAHWEVGAAGVLTRVMRRILEAGDGPRDIVVAHDMGRAYRTGIYPDYKGQKSKKDENKSPVEIEQCDALFDWAKKFFSAMGITMIGVDKVEADDVIAWLHASVPGPKTIHTVDADMLQLIDEDTVVYLKEEAHYFTEEEHNNVPFHFTSLSKSIIGDSSDNYIGVKGMGQKAWDKLREDFGDDGLAELQKIVESGNTDELDAAIEETGSKLLAKLKAQFAEWKVGWRLAHLRPDLCWKPRMKKLTTPLFHKRVPNPARVHKLLQMVGCADLWESEYASLFSQAFAVTAENWEEMREAIFEEIARGDVMTFDYESSDKTQIKDFRRASPRGDNFVDNLSQVLAGGSFQFGRHLENVIYVPVDHKDSPNLPKEVLLEILLHAQKVGVQLVAHNAYFEGIVTKTNLDHWLTNVMDTRMMKRYVDENTPAGLKFLSFDLLGYEQTSYAETLAKGNGGQGVKLMCDLTLDEVFDYGADDALVTGHLFDLLKLRMMLDGCWDFYREWVVRPTEVLQRSYVYGVQMNWALQRRVHERDLNTIEVGMAELRDILKKNVTGNITAGAKSLIEGEFEYIFKSAKRKAEGNEEVARQKLSEWKKKIEASCQYTPYREELVMPAFAFTVLQLNAAAKEVGLPEMEKLNYKAWAAYLEEVGAVGFEDEWGLKANQVEFIKTVSRALNIGCLKLTDLRKKWEESGEEVDEQKYEQANQYMETLGEVIQRLAKVEARVVPFGDPLHVGSPTQMQQLLYCKIGVPVRLRGKAPGKNRVVLGIKEAGPAANEQAILTALANDIDADAWQRDALNVLLKVKSATTRCNLYHDKYPMWRHVDGLVHPYITDAGTDTRRPTANSINVLQVSKKDPEMRSMYIPPNRDYVCVAIDFNGQEIRLMANLANDPVMMSVYDPQNEKDLHSMTASGIAKMGYEEFIVAYNDENHPQHKLTVKLRKKAKGVNFGMAYGAGAGTLSRNLIVPKDEAQMLLDNTFALYCRIQPWQQETARFMEQNGFTLTSFGTKRHALPEIFSSDNGKVSRQHRQGTNATIQSTAAEMLHKVLTCVAASGMMDRLRMQFFAPIYDEVVAWVHKEDVFDYCHEMGGYMEDSTPPGHKVRQVPEFSIGPDWGRVHELKRDISAENVAKYVEMSLNEATDIWEHDVLQPFDPIRKHVYVEVDEDEEEELELCDEE